MGNYLHHVPGRLRVRCRSLRCDPTSCGSMLRRLRTMNGVTSVRLNPTAASLTVHYDPQATGPEPILEFLGHRGLQPAAPQPPRTPASPGITGEIGRIALSVLVNKGVTYSLSSVLGARV